MPNAGAPLKTLKLNNKGSRHDLSAPPTHCPESPNAVSWDHSRGPMRRRIFATAAVGAAAALALAAGAAAARPHAYHASRTPSGQPDLQGTWSAASLTGLERTPGEPLTFATRAEEQAFMR